MDSDDSVVSDWMAPAETVGTQRFPPGCLASFLAFFSICK